MKIRQFDYDNDIEKLIVLDRYIMGQRTAEVIKKHYKDYRGEILVAVEGDEIIGYISISFPYWNKVAFIDYMAVVEQKRSQGIGKKLLAEIERIAREKKARFIAVHTPPWNLRGIKFYKREGFHYRAILPDYFGDGENLSWMDKDLREI